MDEIILVGAGGHTRACIDVIELSGKFKVTGLVDKNKSFKHEIIGYPVIGIDEDLQKLRHKFKNVLITIGQIKSPETRINLFHLLHKLDYTFPSIVSPKAYVSKHAKIGDGTIVMHDALINSNSIVGKNCIINNKALIDHDSIIGDHCHVATGSIVNGQVTVGNGCLIGSGAIIKQSIIIGSNCVIGAGVVVKHNVEPKQVIRN